MRLEEPAYRAFFTDVARSCDRQIRTLPTLEGQQ
jgi:hypothetical protein